MPHDGNIDRFVSSLGDLLEITPFGDGEIVALSPEGSVYQFDAASLVPHDAGHNIKPSASAFNTPGRWVKKALAFGAHFQREESEGIASTSAATFADKMQLFAQGRKGDYRFSWEARFSVTTPNALVEVQILESAVQVDLYSTVIFDASSKFRIGWSTRRLLTGVSVLYRMRFRKVSGPGSVNLEKASMELVRMGT